MVHEKHRHINLYELAEFSLKSHVKKDLIKTGGFNTVLVCLDDGQEIPPHPEPYYVVFLVLNGKGVITAGNSRYDVEPGHIISVGSNEDRGIRCIERMTIIGIQQPH